MRARLGELIDTISRVFLGRPAALVSHTVEMVLGWWQVTRRPPGVKRSDWYGFLRARLTCVVRGHAPPRQLHRQKATGSRTTLELKDVCGRCGEEFTVRRSTAQFPRARGPEAWKS